MRKIIQTSQIELKQPKKVIFSCLPEKITYSGSNYDLSPKLTGKGIKIAVLDSGCSSHKDIKNAGESINFCENNKNVYDNFGHSTIVSGVIGGNNKKKFMGYAPDSWLYYAKVINDSGKGSFNSLIGGILWAIVKDVDVILMSLGIKFDYSVFHDVIKKAYKNDIALISVEKNEFPANYHQVLSVGNKKTDVMLKNKQIYSTYLNNKYMKASGSSISAAIVTGIAALLLEKNEKKIKPNNLYKELKEIFKETT